MDLNAVASGRRPQNGRQPLYPRSLMPFEKSALLWLLPDEKPGYREYRQYITSWPVVGEGRRGPGNFILAEASGIPDTESPLPPVFAYGIIETDRGDISITLRELFSGQLEYEIASMIDEEIPETFVEIRRWNFSSWSPHDPCPMCGNPAREVTMSSESGVTATLAICAGDKRLWVCDGQDGVNHLIPVTNFHNALMLHKNIRDPDKALAAENLFKSLHTFSDADLTAAFVRYNKLRKKVEWGPGVQFLAVKKTLRERVMSLFGK